MTCIISCLEHLLNNYIRRETINFYTLINLSPNTWSKHQFISDSKGGLQQRHKTVGAVHFHSSSFSSHVRKAIRTKPHRIWGNYKSESWPKIHAAHETSCKASNALQKHYLALSCCVSLNSSRHYDMWILALMKAWQAAWMAVPAAPLDPDELEGRQFWSTNSTQLSTAKTQARTKNWRTVKKNTNPLISELLLMLYINHVVNRTQWITLPTKMLGVLWSFDGSALGGGEGYVEKFS